jgi:hypothetical protein
VRNPSDKGPGRSRAVGVSIALHIVLGAALVRILLIPLPFTRWFQHNHIASIPVERISFLALPMTGGETKPGRSGGDGRPVAKTPVRPLVAPSAVPSAVPVLPRSTAPAADRTGGSGPVVGTGGPAEGARPEYHDPRVWVATAPMVSAPKSTKERVDSLLTAEIGAHNDSMALVAGRKPGDWTFMHNGQKYGIDQQYIHLGPISIPNAVLALLPLNRVQGNPMAGAAEQLYSARHDEINTQAQRGMDEDAFHTAVRKLRERMDLEKKHQEEQKQEQQQQQQQSSPQTIAKDGSTQ